jgi:hypothetical protein
MAEKLGFYATIYPHDRVFVPERPILTIEPGWTAVPCKEFMRILVVLGLDSQPIGYCSIIGS